MDTFLAIASVRVVHEYSDRPIADESLRRILEAGRVTGSSQNRQQWRFYVVRDRQRLAELAETVYAPTNISGCQAAVAIASTGKGGLDIGRCAQNMVLAAWNEGVGSAPNGVKDIEPAARLLNLSSDESVVTILSFGYPLHPHTPNPDDIDGILRRIKRKALDEVVVWV